jgi:hypothetical protein
MMHNNYWNRKREKRWRINIKKSKKGKNRVSLNNKKINSLARECNRREATKKSNRGQKDKLKLKISAKKNRKRERRSKLRLKEKRKKL